MKKRLQLSILTILCVFCIGLSQSYGKDAIVRVFEIGYMKVEEVETAVKPLLSPVGKVSTYKTTNSLIIKDFPSNIAEIEKLIKKLDTRPEQIRVKIQFVDEKELNNLAFKIKWRHKDTNWSVGNIYTPSKDTYLELTAILEKMKIKRHEVQNLLIISGGKGSIATGLSVPYVDWFYYYSRNYGHYGSTVKFKDVKTGFVVEPRVSGNNINLVITPEISYFTDRENGIIQFSRIATTVNVKDGESIILGGNKIDSNSEAARFFEGQGNTGKKKNLYMLLTATIEK